LKNVLVFLPALAAHDFDRTTILTSLSAFIAFCLVASSVYLLNDLLDLTADRAHPRKRSRPLASGMIPISYGTWMGLGLLLAGTAFSLTLGSAFVAVILAYYATTLAYSVYLKRLIVIDICVLAGLYTMRIVAGGAAAGIPLSVWLLAFSIFFFFSLAAVKRQAELVDTAGRGELSANGRGYKVDDLPIISTIALGAGYVSVLVLALYLNSPAVLELYPTPPVLWGTCCVVLFWITRTVMITHRGQMHDDPIVFAVKDPTSIICAFVILGFTVIATLT
jgi:4-hydroxybenzoate polyprenyltransferase